MEHHIGEVHLGETAADNLVQNIVGALGYRKIDERSLHGQSGLCHDFQCIAVRDKKVLLVIGEGENKGGKKFRNNAERSEAWVKASLTKYYDVTESLRSAGYKTNALLFQNVNDHFPADLLFDIIRKEKTGTRWATELGLPDDCSISLTMSLEPLPTFFNKEVMNVAQNMGFPYFSLTDLDYKSLKDLTVVSEGATKQLSGILKQQGLHQFFFPAADEYVLSCIDKGKLKPGDKALESLMAVGEESGTEFQDSLHVDNVTLRDPLAIAKELEKSKAISFESEVIITEKGRSIRQKISTTPQESLIIKVLKSISIKSVISLAFGAGAKKE